MGNPPTTFEDLFKFYADYVKPLYCTVQLTGTLPVEVLFEINAALDHISRRWTYGETEAHVVEKAYSHFKRSCLDIFKLAAKQAVDQFNELQKVDTSIINNGEFDRQLIALFSEIKAGAAEARQSEGDTRGEEGAVKAFDLWVPVYQKCIKLNVEYFGSVHVNWAMKKEARGKWFERFIGFVSGLLTGFIVWGVTERGCKPSADSAAQTKPSVTQPAAP